MEGGPRAGGAGEAGEQAPHVARGEGGPASTRGEGGRPQAGGAAGPSVAPGGRAGASPRGRRRGRIARLAVVVVLALASVSCLAYPYASDWMYRRAQESVIHSQAEVVEATPAADLSAQWEAARNYNQRIRGGMARVDDPFNPDGLLAAGAEEYWGLLNLAGDGVIGSIHVPRLGISTPIYHGTNEKTLEEGAGHVENTSLPVGGLSTHAVLAGHSGLPSVRIFDALEDAEVGDYFVIQVLDGELAYRVYAIDVVLPTETGSLAIQRDRDLVTLVTCTPYGINDHRLLVHGKRCEVPADWLERQSGGATGGLLSPEDSQLWLYTAIGGVVAAVVLIAAFIARRRRRARRNASTR